MFERLKGLLFENRGARQTFTKNVFWLSFANISNRLIRAVLIIYAARALGVAGYGIFSYAVGLASFFSIFSDMGIGGLVTKETAQDRESLKKYFSAAVLTKACLMAGSAILIIFVAPFFTNIKEAVPLLPFAALLIAFDGFRDLSAAITRAWERMELEAVIGILTNTSITVLGIVALVWHPTPRFFLFLYALGSGVGMIAAIWILRKTIAKSWGNFTFSTVKTILAKAVPFSLAGLLGALMLNTDTVILGYFVTATAMGLYSAAQRPVMVLFAIPSILSTAIFPSMARLAKESAERFGKVLETALTASFLLSLPIFAGGAILATDFIRVLFGVEYIGGAPTFAVILFTIILAFPQAFLINGIFAFGEQKKFIRFIIVGVLGNAILDILFIPRFGIIGSAYATVITSIIITLLMWQEMKRLVRFETLKHLKKIFLSTVAMSVVVFFLQNVGVPMLVNIPVSAVIYGLTLYLLKEPVLEEFLVPLRRLRGVET